MHFELPTEAVALGDSLSRFLRNRHSFEQHRVALASPHGRDPGLWQAMQTELALACTSFPERFGGAGGGALEHMVIMQALGRALLPEPYFSTAAIAGAFLEHASGEVRKTITEGIISGKVLCAFAHAEPQSRHDLMDVQTSATRTSGGWLINGRKSLVRAAPWSSQMIVVARTAGDRHDAHGISLFLVPTHWSGVRRSDYRTLDGVTASEVWFEDVLIHDDLRVGELHHAAPLIEAVVDKASATLCAEAVGCMQEMRDLTLAYCLQRQQFGQAIAQFQSVQHRLARMQVVLEQAVSATYLATLSLDKPAPERALAVSAAKVTVGHAIRFVGQSAVQLHGGIGTTDELAVAHLFKRATVLEQQFGSVDHHLQRHMRLSRRLAEATA